MPAIENLEQVRETLYKVFNEAVNRQGAYYDAGSVEYNTAIPNR